MIDNISSHEWGQKRNFNGYVQYKFNGEKNWTFCIYGFGGKHLDDGGDSLGGVAKINGTYEWCKMDTKDRVFINGKWYGKKYWNH